MKCQFQECECRYQKDMTPKEFRKDDKKNIYRVENLFLKIFIPNDKFIVQTKSCGECELYDPHNPNTGGCLQPTGKIVIAVIIILIILL